jgi:tryptophanyl-tRNA synthetase
MSKKIFLSGIQPTNIPHIGNYLGAIKNWVKSQDSPDGKAEGGLNSFYFLADLHAITVRQEPKAFEQQILDCYALFLAMGLDPDKSSLFVQSHVPEHSELTWILGCFAQFGELSRMTQFKDKAASFKEGESNVGLFSYPVLQAADILIYNADYVPVGKDQKQHLELSRDIAARFNNAYGETFKLPEPYITQETAKIMSLSEPLKKMSKSDENKNATVFMLDDRDTVIKKFKRAVTDSEANVEFREGDENKAGINNLMSIYSAVTGLTFDDIKKLFNGKGYGEFKTTVGEIVADMLLPIQEQYEKIRKDNVYLEVCMRKGAEKARTAAHPMLREVQKKIGFLQLKEESILDEKETAESEDRKRIIEVIKEGLKDDENVFALWLEGADGLGRTDSFSDVDFWLDVEDGFEEATLDKCEKLLQTIGNLDFVDRVEHNDTKLFQRNMHIEDTSEYLLIDICIQSHSRGRGGCTFYSDDIAEFPLVLFDKAEVVTILPPERISKEALAPVFERCISKYSQRARLMKYIKRRRFLEAYSYFEQYVRQPIINMLRLIYTPRRYEYGYTHLSEHFPKKVVDELEELYIIRSVEDIEKLLEKADEIYYDAYNALKGMLL